MRHPNAATGTHIPVLLHEVMAALAPKDGGIYLDGTFGAGGYSRALLAAANTKVYAIDRDPQAIAAGAALQAEGKDRLVLMLGTFGEMESLLADQGVAQVDGIALDLGVSSMQIDEAARGFSFRFDGPLDMRMGGEASGLPSAADLVNTVEETDLADLIYTYGEERRSRAVARAIAKRRAELPFKTTLDLAEVVRRAVGPKPKGTDRIDPATRTFQALRIAVNDELGELERGLDAAERLLSAGGRLAVVSFHSLEDRLVKRHLQTRAGRAGGSRHAPESTRVPSFRLLQASAVKASPEEIAANPRARSARLRVGERVIGEGAS